jgi:anti-sigma B factor antagonist
VRAAPAAQDERTLDMSIDEDCGPTGEGARVTDTGVLRFSVLHDGDTAVLALVGELDLASTAELAASFDDLLGTGADIVVDLTDLRFIDSTGMAVLVRAQKAAEANGHRVTLRHPAANVAKTLGLAGLESVFVIEP